MKLQADMKQPLTLIIILLLGLQANSQKLNKPELKYLLRVWGEVSELIPEHTGKEDLILLTINKDKTFFAFENTDYGATILQSGTWKTRGMKITFKVTNTTLGRKEKEYFMKGHILEGDKGIITYEIINLEENKFVIKAINSGKTITFKQTKYVYFPEGVHIDN